MLTSRVLEMAKVGLYLWKTRHKRVTSPSSDDAGAKQVSNIKIIHILTTILIAVVLPVSTAVQEL